MSLISMCKTDAFDYPANGIILSAITHIPRRLPEKNSYLQFHRNTFRHARRYIGHKCVNRQ